MTIYKQAETDSAPARLEDVLDKLIQAERAMVWTRAIDAIRADYERQKVHGVRRRIVE